MRTIRRLRSSSGEPGHIFLFDAEDVEAVEEGPLAPEQQLPEIGATVRVQAADFAVEHAGKRADGVCDFLRELRPLFKRVTVPRDELAVVA